MRRTEESPGVFMSLHLVSAVLQIANASANQFGLATSPPEINTTNDFSWDENGYVFYCPCHGSSAYTVLWHYCWPCIESILQGASGTRRTSSWARSTSRDGSTEPWFFLHGEHTPARMLVTRSSFRSPLDGPQNSCRRLQCLTTSSKWNLSRNFIA